MPYHLSVGKPRPGVIVELTASSSSISSLLSRQSIAPAALRACRSLFTPAIGIAPLDRHQLSATCAGVLAAAPSPPSPAWALPTIRIRETRGATSATLAGVIVAARGPPGKGAVDDLSSPSGWYLPVRRPWIVVDFVFFAVLEGKSELKRRDYFFLLPLSLAPALARARDFFLTCASGE